MHAGTVPENFNEYRDTLPFLLQEKRSFLFIRFAPPASGARQGHATASSRPLVESFLGPDPC